LEVRKVIFPNSKIYKALGEEREMTDEIFDLDEIENALEEAEEED